MPLDPQSFPGGGEGSVYICKELKYPQIEQVESTFPLSENTHMKNYSKMFEL